MGEHQAAGNLDRVELQGGPAVAGAAVAAVAGAGRHTQHHGLGGAQQLVVHLMSTQTFDRNGEVSPGNQLFLHQLFPSEWDCAGYDDELRGTLSFSGWAHSFQ